MSNKKGEALSVVQEIVIVLLILAAIFYLVFPKLGITKNTFFGIVGTEKKCGVTEKTLTEYKSDFSLFFQDPDKYNKDIIQECEEISSCFPKEYSSFKEKCESAKAQNIQNV